MPSWSTTRKDRQRIDGALSVRDTAARLCNRGCSRRSRLCGQIATLATAGLPAKARFAFTAPAAVRTGERAGLAQSAGVSGAAALSGGGLRPGSGHRHHESESGKCGQSHKGQKLGQHHGNSFARSTRETGIAGAGPRRRAWNEPRKRRSDRQILRTALFGRKLISASGS